MNWFKRKSKEEVQEELENRLASLNEQYKDELMSYCKYRDHIFIPLSFKIEDAKIKLLYKNEFTRKDMHCIIDFSTFSVLSDLKSARAEFIKFKHRLNLIGLDVKKIKHND